MPQIEEKPEVSMEPPRTVRVRHHRWNPQDEPDEPDVPGEEVEADHIFDIWDADEESWNEDIIM
jgi:hypothetical protein